MDLITVKTFDNYFNANITLTKLQDAGYECYLKDDYTVTMDPLLTNAIGGIKLVVKDTEKDEVLAVLHEFDEEYRKAAVCPKCEQSQFEQITKPSAGNYLTTIFTWLFSNYAAPAKYVYQCGNCGYESEKLPEKDFNEE